MEVRSVELDADSIAVTSDFVAQRFARVDIESLEVNVEPHGRWAEGWGIGLLVGGACGALLEHSARNSDDGMLYGRVLLGVLGSTVGAFVGSFAQGKWVSADQPSGRVSVAPVVGRRTGLAARFSF